MPYNTEYEVNGDSCGWLPSAELNGALWVAGTYEVGFSSLILSNPLSQTYTPI